MKILSILSLFSIVGVVNGHGWLESPLPRSAAQNKQTSNLGSGNASTRSACGNGQNTAAGAVQATYSKGQQITVTYARANAHGNTGNDVKIGLTMTSNGIYDPATAIDLTAGGALPMDVTINGPQTGKVTLPSTAQGAGVLQFQWTPTNGGSWFDCADIMINPPADPAVCNKRSPACQDSCTPVQNGICSCDAGRYPTASDSSTCAALPPSVDIVVSLQGQLQPSYNVNGQTMTQQDFLTYNFGSVFNLAGRVTFNSVTAFPAPGNNTVSVYLTMLSDPVKGDPAQNAANVILSYVGAHSIAGQTIFPVPIVQAQQPSVNTLVNAGAGYTPIYYTPNSTESMGGPIAAVLIISALAGIGAFVYQYRGGKQWIARKLNGSASNSSPTKLNSPASTPKTSNGPPAIPSRV